MLFKLSQVLDGGSEQVCTLLSASSLKEAIRLVKEDYHILFEDSSYDVITFGVEGISGYHAYFMWANKVRFTLVVNECDYFMINDIADYGE